MVIDEYSDKQVLQGVEEKVPAEQQNIPRNLKRKAISLYLLEKTAYFIALNNYTIFYTFIFFVLIYNLD